MIEDAKGIAAPATATAADTAKRAALAKAAQQFEAVFLRQMIGSMRQAHLSEDIMGSSATDQFRDMSDARLADQMASQNSLGIAQLLLNQFGAKAGGSLEQGAKK